MSDYITLLGAEDVRRAGSTIDSAASTMQKAASAIDDSLDRHRRFLDEWIWRFEEIINKASEAEKGEGGTWYRSNYEGPMAYKEVEE